MHPLWCCLVSKWGPSSWWRAYNRWMSTRVRLSPSRWNCHTKMWKPPGWRMAWGWKQRRTAALVSRGRSIRWLFLPSRLKTPVSSPSRQKVFTQQADWLCQVGNFHHSPGTWLFLWCLSVYWGICPKYRAYKVLFGSMCNILQHFIGKPVLSRHLAHTEAIFGTGVKLSYWCASQEPLETLELLLVLRSWGDGTGVEWWC